MQAKSLQSWPTLCDPTDCSLPGSSVHGILQARILEWVARPSSRGSSRPRDWTRIPCVSCVTGRFFAAAPPWKPMKSSGWARVAQRVKRLPTMRETWVLSLGREDPLEKELATTPVLLPGESHGRRSLVGYSPRGRKESDTTERLHFQSNMVGVFIKTGNLYMKTSAHRGDMMWRDTGKSQPSIRQAEKPGTDPSLTALREIKAVNTSLSDFHPPELWDNKFLW